MAEHPMDNIPVRKLRFDFNAVDNLEPVWSHSNPEFSIFINALGIDVPYFEKFLVRVMREYRDELDNQDLRDEVQAIIGQESHHAFNFLKWAEVMTHRYPRLRALEEHARIYFENAQKRSKKFKIGFTAGYETFTFLGGMIILDRYQELMADADPTIRALWVWHQVEEVEHGAVAFDFYREFYPDEEWYRRWMVLRAFGHICWETFKAYAHMIRIEAYYKSPRRTFIAWRFFASFAWDLAASALPVLSRRYHPRNHPICNTEQNQVAIAWRRHNAAGHDSLSLSNRDMENMLNQP